MTALFNDFLPAQDSPAPRRQKITRWRSLRPMEGPEQEEGISLFKVLSLPLLLERWEFWESLVPYRKTCLWLTRAGSLLIEIVCVLSFLLVGKSVSDIPAVKQKFTPCIIYCFSGWFHDLSVSCLSGIFHLASSFSHGSLELIHHYVLYSWL